MVNRQLSLPAKGAINSQSLNTPHTQLVLLVETVQETVISFCRHLHTYNTTISCSNLLIIIINILHVGKCEPPETGENMNQSNREAVSFLEDSQILISCSPGYSMLNGKSTIVTCTCSSSDTSCSWSPDPAQLQCLSMWSVPCLSL